MAGGTAVVLGSLMPWISFNDAGAEVKPGVQAASVVLGLVVMALGFALRVAPQPGRLAAGIATLGLTSLAGLLYVGFILNGINGVPQQDLFGDITTVTYSPNIGIILAVAGCGAAFVAAIMSFHHRQACRNSRAPGSRSSSGRVKDRDINTNRSAHRTRSPFQAKSRGSRR